MRLPRHMNAGVGGDVREAGTLFGHLCGQAVQLDQPGRYGIAQMVEARQRGGCGRHGRGRMGGRIRSAGRERWRMPWIERRPAPES